MEEGASEPTAGYVSEDPYCEPCEHLGQRIAAETVCTVCDEHLCTHCTKKHAVAKASKGHEIVPVQDESYKKTKQSMTPELFCDPCEALQTPSKASAFCKECEELLCIDCVDAHAAQKATKQHIPIDIKDYLNENQKKCDICDGVTAKKFCQECMQVCCDKCSMLHAVQKATKHHTIVLYSELSTEKSVDCDPCLHRQQKIPADKYCQECEEHLCNSCSTSHQTRKATKDHKLVNKGAHAIEVKFECDVCKLSGQNQDATFSCLECDENLCRDCKYLHMNRKATKDHKIADINSLNKIDHVCDICTGNAVHFCKICTEYLCAKCGDIHMKQKATASHILTSPSESVIYEWCDPCLTGNENKVAEQFCTDCEENLCASCSSAHVKQKASRGHELCKIKDKMPKSKSIWCDGCFIHDENKSAVNFCENCQENFCDDCLKHHTRQKATKHHSFNNPKEIKAANLCDPCNRLSVMSNAPHYCKECKEYFCEDCKSQHDIDKSTSKHTTVDASLSSEMTGYCQICETNNKQSVATSFCLTCTERELFCNSCSKRHTNIKSNLRHELSYDFTLLTQIKDEKTEVNEGNVTKDITDTQGDMEVDDENQPTKEQLLYDTVTPGKPVAGAIKANSLELSWKKPDAFEAGDTYQVRYKDLDAGGKWKFIPQEYTSSTVTLTDLKANTKFIFQVRMIKDDEEGMYSEVSDEVFTDVSPGTRLQNFSKLVNSGTPSLYALPLTELREARCVPAKSRKFEIGSPPQVIKKERTIMLVGATGTGKSTLVDGFINYILGVNWNDPYRFTIINLEEEEQQRTSNQALSQTEWITCYTINPEKGSRLDYRLNIIDTPGFGDTRGLQRDNEIVNQIRELFSAKSVKSVAVIDAVCFLIKAPDARLTASQKYIFHAIMSLFGQDIEHNICSLITFADGQEPPVIASLQEANLPFGRHFTFNNSGLFSKNTDLDSSSLSPMFWEMGVKSYRAFFDNLSRMETKSLSLTKQVLDERQKLELTIASLQPQVDAGLSKVHALKQELRIIQQHQSDIKDNKNFEYEVEETSIEQKELPKGQHVTNCLQCHITCHDNCGYADDEDKQYCGVMDRSTGNCTICSGKCYWKQHKNMPYIFQFTKKKVKKTYQEKLSKYESATGHLLNAEQVIEKMYEEFEELEDGIEWLMEEVKESSNRLKEIALRPNPLSMVEHLDLMIEAEKMEKKDGFQGRINALLEFKKKAEITKDVERLSQEAKGTRRKEKKTDKSKKSGFSLMGFMKKWNPF